MENIKYKLDLLKENHIELRKAEIYYHILIFGYVLTHLKKKFKNRKQLIINERWRINNPDKIRKIRRNAAYQKYHNDEDYREKKKASYYVRKEFKSFLNIDL